MSISFDEFDSTASGSSTGLFLRRIFGANLCPLHAAYHRTAPTVCWHILGQHECVSLKAAVHWAMALQFHVIEPSDDFALLSSRHQMQYRVRNEVKKLPLQ